VRTRALRIVGGNAEHGVTWIHSYVSADKERTYCVYEAPSPGAIQQVARRNDLPIERITEVTVLDPYFLSLTSAASLRFGITRDLTLAIRHCSVHLPVSPSPAHEQTVHSSCSTHGADGIMAQVPAGGQAHMELLERESALQSVREALGEARAGRGRSLLVSGEAGIGKTPSSPHSSRRNRCACLVGRCEALFFAAAARPLVRHRARADPALPSLISKAAHRSELFAAVLASLLQRRTSRCW
jgi:hypothetical protein